VPTKSLTKFENGFRLIHKAGDDAETGATTTETAESQTLKLLIISPLANCLIYARALLEDVITM